MLVLAVVAGISAVAWTFGLGEQAFFASASYGRQHEARAAELATPAVTQARPHGPEATSSEFAGVAREMTPAAAYAAAVSIVRCEAVLVPVGPQLGRTAEQVLQQKLSSMEGLDCDKLNSSHSPYELAKYAAESGDIDAQLNFPGLAATVFEDPVKALDQELIAEYRRDSLKYLHSAARRGKFDALRSISESYQVGRYSERDPVLAYAYAEAYASRTTSPWANELPASLGQGLTPQQIVRGREIARGLLR